MTAVDWRDAVVIVSYFIVVLAVGLLVSWKNLICLKTLNNTELIYWKFATYECIKSLNLI